MRLHNGQLVADPLDAPHLAVTPAPVGTPVVVGPRGPQGDPGPAGPAGPQGLSGSGLNYVHTQATPASVWSITHTLGKLPAVVVIDSANEVCEGDIAYPSATQVVITFSAAFSGRAILN